VSAAPPGHQHEKRCPRDSRRDAGATKESNADAEQTRICTGLLLSAIPVFATDLAILHNGFSVRHERRENWRCHSSLSRRDNSSYVDIATDQIERFEKDLSPSIAIAPLAGVAAAKPQNLNEVINTISDRIISIRPHHSVIHRRADSTLAPCPPKGHGA